MKSKKDLIRLLLPVCAGTACCILFTYAAKAQHIKNSQKKETVFAGKSTMRIVSQAGINIAAVDKSTGLFISPSVGLLVNERLFMGVASNFLINKQFVKDAAYTPLKNEEAHWEMNYYGFKIEHTAKPLKAVTIGAGAVCGFGTVERDFTWNGLTKQSPEWQKLDTRLCRKGYFFFTEPEVFVNFNLSNSVLIRINTSYRIISIRNKENLSGITNAKFSKPLAGITLQFSGIVPGQSSNSTN